MALFDFDKDGWLDVFLANSPTVATAGTPGSARSALWRNNHDGTFTDVTSRAGVGDVGWAMGASTGDYDNDGWTDLYVTCFGANHLFRNNGDGTFTDVTARAGVGDTRWSTGAAFGDYDNDGNLDLFVANYVDLRLDALPEFGAGQELRLQGAAGPVRPAWIDRRGRYALPQQRRRNVQRRVGRGRRVRHGQTVWHGRGVVRLQRRRANRFVCGERFRPQLSVPQQRQRDVYGRWT